MADGYPIVYGVSFKAIPGIPGYRAGDDGSIWGCWNNQGEMCSQWKIIKPHRYGNRLCILLRANGERRSYQVHNLVLLAFRGPKPDGNEACFLDGDGANVRLTNLRWAPRNEVRFWSRLRVEPNGCWVWTGTRHPNGYGKIGVNYRHESTHRLAYRLAVGEIPDDLHVLHRCDNRPCCRPDHLFLGTQKDNMDDMTAKGRRVNGNRSGERNGNSRLTKADVLEIRRRFPLENRTKKEFGKEYGVSKTTILHILERRIWKHIP